MFNSKGFLNNQSSHNQNLFPVNVFISKNLSDNEIIDACIQLFSLSEKDICVTQDITIEMPDYIQLLCEKESIQGDFKILLSLYPQNDLIEQSIGKIGDEIAIAKKFADYFHCQCMVADNSPFEDYEEDLYFLVKDTSNNVQKIYINLDQIDDNIYTIQN
ncbi:hypothetical protein [Microcystis sp. BLCC-F210]|jgi:hypothetical protein|uniref:Uncharacterized protein n=1 Tax=Microcystis aeruginosa Ma_MB_F_20061100_S20D TaxID=2486253 RepID=A0A552EG08_MICAE|nr:MAG: hypothetical protein EWV50_21150 [Microcystis aeruginosa Ma_MB_F_20061100_S20]TRU33281.1 MAG: hypothetical protein EWV78_15665 [Microcystis aeruginosa Ma_MB_F_20061100_S20D]